MSESGLLDLRERVDWLMVWLLVLIVVENVKLVGSVGGFALIDSLSRANDRAPLPCCMAFFSIWQATPSGFSVKKCSFVILHYFILFNLWI